MAADALVELIVGLLMEDELVLEHSSQLLVLLGG